MAKHRTHSIEFKRQVVQEFLGGEPSHALARRHGISRNLIEIWVAKYEAGGLDSDTAAADVLADYEARIARLVGKRALENEFLRGLAARSPAEKRQHVRCGCRPTRSGTVHIDAPVRAARLRVDRRHRTGSEPLRYPFTPKDQSDPDLPAHW
jgi:transposase-like protein